MHIYIYSGNERVRRIYIYIYIHIYIQAMKGLEGYIYTYIYTYIHSGNERVRRMCERYEGGWILCG
jgi:hypothetical protein